MRRAANASFSSSALAISQPRRTGISASPWRELWPAAAWRCRACAPSPNMRWRSRASRADSTPSASWTPFGGRCRRTFESWPSTSRRAAMARGNYIASGSTFTARPSRVLLLSPFIDERMVDEAAKRWRRVPKRRLVAGTEGLMTVALGSKREALRALEPRQMCPPPRLRILRKRRPARSAKTRSSRFAPFTRRSSRSMTAGTPR